MKKYSFEAELKKVDGKEASYIEIPFDVEKEFGVKRVKVRALFDGVEYRGAIVRMGLPCYMIGVTKEIREKIERTYGDIINVVIEKDIEDRNIEIPEELNVMFNDNKNAYEFYENLSYSQKKNILNG
ncbi:Domain of uncharacterised function (DUF1905) [uncultured Clostridium sp.]|nr:YdeI/OmpD-associated family protein [uncultured Clostridium sp.]SCJ63768.1 Domain of uncharacterised function (DUF1905) [uncultured Clostridium sp.]